MGGVSGVGLAAAPRALGPTPTGLQVARCQGHNYAYPFVPNMPLALPPHSKNTGATHMSMSVYRHVSVCHCVSVCLFELNSIPGRALPS